MTQSTSLITITQSLIGGESVQAVSARDVHSFLEVNKAFTDWMPTQIKRGKFQEGVDFEVLHLQGTNPLGGRPRKDYLLTQRMAEHIGMMSGTEKGKQIRDWFQVQRDVAQGVAVQAQPSGPMDIVAQIGQALSMLAANAQETKVELLGLKQEQKHLAEKVDAMEADRVAAVQTLTVLPSSPAGVPDLTARARVNMAVRSWVVKNNGKGPDFQAAWGKLFDQFKYRHRTDLVTRAKHAGCHALDVAEELGVIEDLYALALHLFGEAA